MPLEAIVHYGVDYDNAFWNGRQMIFGDGDRRLFNRFTGLDMVAKQFGDGVVQATAKLAYYGQSGSLSNAIAMVFASLVKQYALHQTASQADWLIGEGLLAPGIKGRALLSLAAPGTAYDDPILGTTRSRVKCAITSRRNPIMAASTPTRGSSIAPST